MKVVYAKTVFEKIQDARDEAEKWYRKIDYIELTEAEWSEIAWLYDPLLTGMNFIKHYVLGVEVRKAP